MNAKEELTKLIMESYDRGVKDTKQAALTAFQNGYEKGVAAFNGAVLLEREACAKLVESLPAPDIYSNTDRSMWDITCMDCADAIRARGQA